MSYYQTISLTLLLFNLFFNGLGIKTGKREYMLVSYIFIILLGLVILYDILYEEDRTSFEYYLDIIQSIMLIYFGILFVKFYIENCGA